MISKYTEDGKTFYEVKVFQKMKDRTQRAKKRRGIASEREAKRLEVDFKRELLEEFDIDTSWTWSKWHEHAIEKMELTLNASTILQYDGRLKKYIPTDWKNKLLTEFTAHDIHRVVNSDSTGELASRSKHTLLRLIGRVFEMAVEEGVLARNPANGLKVTVITKQKLVLSAPEAKILLQEGQNNAHSHYPLWVFALWSGMRSGEMYALRWPDVDLESGLIHVTRAWTDKAGISTPKNNKTRVVPMSNIFKTWLREYRMIEPGYTRDVYDLASRETVQYSDFVLPTLKDWTDGLQAQVLRDFCKEIGITQVRFHDLRATFITNLLANGVALAKVMAIVGHSKMSTTDVYLRLAGVNVRGATDALSYEIPDAVNAADVLHFKPRNGL